ncbi:VWA domain-containing protein [Rhodococcus triatomae]|uniref:Mg-chelatase subunit ChlD n=1 Tax=Rhodococcus triatomae TaxID=300028 RepID=A0A1G8ALE2_9NOCA|nr:substrate-binding domain-containing protein [Rhodococcus triatomae]QNG17734.1 VWA domain-containing protein [Rhodococcus triatomae]QNG22599.1 VWA domain-containing protein [Rhodococcus triatomae]SDH21737.1 Mg-chelatase subunit ChlD [Rhodococcus triatomae]
MGGRHQAKHLAERKSRRGLVYAGAAVAALLVVGAGAYVVASATGGCGEVSEYTVAADPSIAAAVGKVVSDTDPGDLGCASFSVSERDSAQPPTPGEDAPNFWIPDSSLSVARASAAGTVYPVATESLAATPIVLVSQAGEQVEFASWLDVVRVQGLQLGDPQSDTVSAGPVVAALAEAESDAADPNAVIGALVSMAQSQAADAAVPSATARLDGVSARGGIAVVSEQQAVGVSTVSASVPATGSVFLDYPLIVTSDGDGVDEAGSALTEALAGEAGVAALHESGLRGADRAALPDGRGVGDVPSLRVGEPAVVVDTLTKYSVLAKPSRALVVQDVSGSMNYTAGSRTRVALAAEAGETGSRLFPDAAQLGLWVFSTGHSGTRDHTEIVPIRPLDEDVDGSSQRELLVQGLRSLPDRVGGGTALYDTTLAAFREVKDGYDPAYVNSVIILTDGSNEDPNSIGLEELLATLQAEQDPARPVLVVTIGITDDADAAVLERISSVTGGTSHVARTPSEIPTVFVDALESRTG